MEGNNLSLFLDVETCEQNGEMASQNFLDEVDDFEKLFQDMNVDISGDFSAIGEKSDELNHSLRVQDSMSSEKSVSVSSVVVQKNCPPRKYSKKTEIKEVTTGPVTKRDIQVTQSTSDGEMMCSSLSETQNASEFSEIAQLPSFDHLDSESDMDQLIKISQMGTKVLVSETEDITETVYKMQEEKTVRKTVLGNEVHENVTITSSEVCSSTSFSSEFSTANQVSAALGSGREEALKPHSSAVTIHKEVCESPDISSVAEQMDSFQCDANNSHNNSHLLAGPRAGDKSRISIDFQNLAAASLNSNEKPEEVNELFESLFEKIDSNEDLIAEKDISVEASSNGTIKSKPDAPDSVSNSVEQDSERIEESLDGGNSFTIASHPPANEQKEDSPDFISPNGNLGVDDKMKLLIDPDDPRLKEELRIYEENERKRRSMISSSNVIKSSNVSESSELKDSVTGTSTSSAFLDSMLQSFENVMQTFDFDEAHNEGSSNVTLHSTFNQTNEEVSPTETCQSDVKSDSELSTILTLHSDVNQEQSVDSTVLTLHSNVDKARSEYSTGITSMSTVDNESLNETSTNVTIQSNFEHAQTEASDMSYQSDVGKKHSDGSVNVTFMEIVDLNQGEDSTDFEQVSGSSGSHPQKTDQTASSSRPDAGSTSTSSSQIVERNSSFKTEEESLECSVRERSRKFSSEQNSENHLQTRKITRKTSRIKGSNIEDEYQTMHGLTESGTAGKSLKIK